MIKLLFEQIKDIPNLPVNGKVSSSSPALVCDVCVFLFVDVNNVSVLYNDTLQVCSHHTVYLWYFSRRSCMLGMFSFLSSFSSLSE